MGGILMQVQIGEERLPQHVLDIIHEFAREYPSDDPGSSEASELGIEGVSEAPKSASILSSQQASVSLSAISRSNSLTTQTGSQGVPGKELEASEASAAPRKDSAGFRKFQTLKNIFSPVRMSLSHSKRDSSDFDKFQAQKELRASGSRQASLQSVLDSRRSSRQSRKSKRSSAPRNGKTDEAPKHPKKAETLNGVSKYGKDKKSKPDKHPRGSKRKRSSKRKRRLSGSRKKVLATCVLAVPFPGATRKQTFDFWHNFPELVYRDGARPRPKNGGR